MCQPEKVETVSPSSDTGTTHVTLVKVPCCQLSYIPYVFKHYDLLVLRIIILWKAVCITLYSQNQNTTFKIRFWVSTHGLWRAGSSERRVIPSKLMKRGWKYPLKHQEGGEGTPLKDTKLGALAHHFCGKWLSKNEDEWNRKTEIKKLEFPAGGKAWKMVFWPSLGWRGGAFNSPVFSANGGPPFLCPKMPTVESGEWERGEKVRWIKKAEIWQNSLYRHILQRCILTRSRHKRGDNW